MKLLHHCLKASNAEVNHPGFTLISKVIRIYRKRSDDRWTGFLRPRPLVVVSRHKINAEVFFIPARYRSWISRAKEKASDSRHSLHALFGWARQYFNYYW